MGSAAARIPSSPQEIVREQRSPHTVLLARTPQPGAETVREQRKIPTDLRQEIPS